MIMIASGSPSLARAVVLQARPGGHGPRPGRARLRPGLAGRASAQLPGLTGSGSHQCYADSDLNVDCFRRRWAGQPGLMAQPGLGLAQ